MMLPGMDRLVPLELAPAPNIDEVVPADEANLRALLDSGSTDRRVLMALGNICLGDYTGESATSVARVQEAQDFYQRALALKESAPLRCNLGIVYLLQNKLPQAVSELSRALLMDSSLAVAYIYLGAAHQLQGDLNAAKVAFEKLTAFRPKESSAHGALAVVCERLGQVEEADRLYSKAFELSSDFLPAELYLGRKYFQRAKAFLESCDLSAAAAILGEGHRQFPRAFVADFETCSGLRKFVEARRDNHDIVALKQEWSKADKTSKEQAAYALTLEFLFITGLIPEHYIAPTSLAEQWSKCALEAGKIFPYLHFRRGLIHLYRGEFVEAGEELNAARDHLPKSKQTALRLNALLEFTLDMAASAGGGEVLHSEATLEDWQKCGFVDVFSQNAWKQTGADPREAAQWRDAGFNAIQARKWKSAGLFPDEAKQWWESGCTEPKDARKWQRGGIGASEVAHWRQFFAEEVELAVQFYQLGFRDAEEAKGWHAVFTFPYEASSWWELGFSPKQAQRWISVGVSDPFVAQAQQGEEAIASDEEGET